MNIQELAEQYANTLVPVSPPRKEGAVLGFIKGAELSIGFAEWLQWNRIEYAGMHSLWKYKGNTITTTDLFTQYLNTKK